MEAAAFVRWTRTGAARAGTAYLPPPSRCSLEHRQCLFNTSAARWLARWILSEGLEEPADDILRRPKSPKFVDHPWDVLHGLGRKPFERVLDGRHGASNCAHKQSSHNAAFGDSARLADDNGTSNRRDDSRSNNAALRHTNRLAIDDGIGRPGTHEDTDK